MKTHKGGGEGTGRAIKKKKKGDLGMNMRRVLSGAEGEKEREGVCTRGKRNGDLSGIRRIKIEKKEGEKKKKNKNKQKTGGWGGGGGAPKKNTKKKKKKNAGDIWGVWGSLP